MAVIGVSHSCLFIELGPICNSMAASLWFKSNEDHSLLKSYNGGLWKNVDWYGPNTRNAILNLCGTCIQNFKRQIFQWSFKSRLVQENFNQMTLFAISSCSIGSVPWIAPEIRRKIRRKNKTYAKAKKSAVANFDQNWISSMLIFENNIIGM